MSEASSNISKLFKAGMSREEFISKYRSLANNPKVGNKSIFVQNLDDSILNTMFNSIHAKASTDEKEGKITNTDITTLASTDGDKSSISDDDIMALYEKTIQSAQIETGTIDSDSSAITPAEGLDLLTNLRNMKIKSATEKKLKLQAQIDELITKDSTLSKQLKDEYTQIRQKAEESEKQLQLKDTEYQNFKLKSQETQEIITRKQAELSETTDENKKSKLQTEISSLSQNTNNIALTSLRKEIRDLTLSSSQYSNQLKTIYNKIEQSNTKTGKKVKETQAKIETIDTNLKKDLEDIDKRMDTIQNQLLLQTQQTGQSSAYYGNMATNGGPIGKTAAQALSNASSQIGVRETSHNNSAQIAMYKNGARNGNAWCASFVSWCYKGNNVFGYQPSVSGIQMAAQKQGLYSKKGTYIPKAGDVMIQKNGMSHTGIVESVDADGTIHTIEGNSGNAVRRVSYRPGSAGYNHISGWVRMSDNASA